MRICSIWQQPAGKVSHLLLIGKGVNSFERGRMKHEVKERTNYSDTSWQQLIMQLMCGILTLLYNLLTNMMLSLAMLLTCLYLIVYTFNKDMLGCISYEKEDKSQLCFYVNSLQGTWELADSDKRTVCTSCNSLFCRKIKH